MLTIVKTFDWLPLTILLVLYQHVRATPVMSDQVALWSDKVQTAIKKVIISIGSLTCLHTFSLSILIPLFKIAKF